MKKNLNNKYKYGFKTKSKPIFTTGKGLSKEVIKKISKRKGEPKWMLDYRLESYENFLKIKNPKWGPDLNFINFNDYNYYIETTDSIKNKWEDVPEEIKFTFERLGIPEAEKKFLSGVSTQFESEVVYHSTKDELEKKGIIYLDTDTALKKYPEIFKKYFSKVVSNNDNKYAALNSALWSGGSFIYVPKNVKLEKPLQSYFRMNSNLLGQFERTLIIVEEGAEITYVEGCTSPIYSNNSLHAAVVEVIVKKNAKMRYTTIQNWSKNVLNLVTERAHVYSGGKMEWVDGNMGSKLNMKYPSSILLEPHACATTISVAMGGKNQVIDSGAKMIHLAPHTKSQIISKSIAHSGAEVNYRGTVFIGEKAQYSKANVECDTMLLDNKSKSDTFPTNKIKSKTAMLEHEAVVSKINKDKLYYLMSRGLTEEQAKEMIVIGFLAPFSKELPMEYAVELNQLLRLQMENSLG